MAVQPDCVLHTTIRKPLSFVETSRHRKRALSPTADALKSIALRGVGAAGVRTRYSAGREIPSAFSAYTRIAYSTSDSKLPTTPSATVPATGPMKYAADGSLSGSLSTK